MTATIVYALPLDPDARLQRWIDWSDKWQANAAWCEGADWFKAASWFFREKFDNAGMRGDWMMVGDPVEQCGRLDRGRNTDLVWRFISLGNGKYRPKLVGTVTEG